MDVNDTERTGARLLHVEEAARLLSIGRTKAYELIADGRLHAIHLGRATRISSLEVDRFIRSVDRQPDPPGGPPGVASSDQKSTPCSIRNHPRPRSGTDRITGRNRHGLERLTGRSHHLPRRGRPLARLDHCRHLLNGTLAVRRTLHRVKGKGLVYEPPKPARSLRTLALPIPLVRALHEHKARQTGERM